MRISDWSSDVCSSDLCRFAGQRTLAAFAVVDLQRQRVVVRHQQLGHLAHELVLHPLRREVVWLSVELRQHVLKQGGEVHGHGAAQRTPLPGALARLAQHRERSEEHTSELQSLMRISYAVFCLKKKQIKTRIN